MQLILQRLCLVFMCVSPMAACAPTGFMGNIWPFQKNTTQTMEDLDAAFAARARQLMQENDERLKQQRAKLSGSADAQNSALSQQLQAEREAAFLVRVEGGEISLDKLDNMAACDMVKSTMGSAVGSDKMRAQKITSMFSVGSVSPYAVQNILLSKCLAARSIPKL